MHAWLIGLGLTNQHTLVLLALPLALAILIAGMVFYDGEMFPDWQGSLLIGGLASQALVRLELDGTRVTGEARYLEGMGRVRDVDVAADGAIMVLTDARNGALIRLTQGG